MQDGKERMQHDNFPLMLGSLHLVVPRLKSCLCDAVTKTLRCNPVSANRHGETKDGRRPFQA